MRKSPIARGRRLFTLDTVAEAAIQEIKADSYPARHSQS
jgi:hypothetical protein